MPTYIAPTKGRPGRSTQLLSNPPPMNNRVSVSPRFGASTPTGRNTVEGVATVAGAGGATALLLNEATGHPVNVTHCDTFGAYQFKNVPAGRYAVVIVDTDGDYRAKAVHVEVYDPLVLNLSSIEASEALSGYPGKVVSLALAASGGKAPYTYAATGLPAGLSLTGNTISGTMTTEGTFTGTLSAEDAQLTEVVVPFTAINIDGYRYFRFHITASNNGNQVGVAEFQFVNSAGDLISLVGKTSSASTVNDSNHAASVANNGAVSDTYAWANLASAGLPCWWMVDMGSIVPSPASYRIWARQTHNIQAPAAWTFQGSKDGVTWDVLDTRSAQTAWGDNQRRDYEIAGETQPAHNVTHLLRFNGANNATSAVDEYGGTLTFAGNAKLSTTTPIAGSASLLLDGSGSYVKLTNDDGLDFGEGDFCVEGFYNPDDLGNRGIFHMYPGVPPSTTWGFACGLSGANYSLYNSVSGGNNLGAHGIAAGATSHMAFYRKGRTLYAAFGGTVRAAIAGVTTSFGTDWDLFIGLYYSSSYCGKGKMDEWRTIKGSSPYGHENFTPPTPGSF